MERSTGSQNSNSDSGDDDAMPSSPSERGFMNVRNRISKLDSQSDDSNVRLRTQMQAERRKTSELVHSIETAFQTFQKELNELKATLPGEGRKSETTTALSRRGGFLSVSDLSIGEESESEKRRKSAQLSQRLLSAGQMGDLVQLKELLERENVKSANVNAVDEEGRSVLHNLIHRITVSETAYGDPGKRDQLKEVIASLLLLGAEINTKDKSGITCVWEVCNEFELDLVEIFVEADRPDYDLMSIEDQVESMVLLVNPNDGIAVHNENHTLWQLAIEKGSIELVKMFTRAQIKLEVTCRDIVVSNLQEAENENETEEEIYHKTQYHDCDRSWDWRMMMLAHDPRAWTLQTNSKGNSIWAQEGSPLHLAITKARTEKDTDEIITVLLADAPIDEDNEQFITLFDPRVVDSNGNTPLHLAAIYGYVNTIEKILQYRFHYNEKEPIYCDINVQNKLQNFTPLMCAVYHGHVQAIPGIFERNNLMTRSMEEEESTIRRLRLQKKGTPKATTRRVHDLTLRSNICGQNVLHLACGNIVEMDSVALLLCQNGAEPNIKDEHGFSSLHLAAMYGHVLIIKCLLKYNANPAAQENFGQETPLHIAAAFGYINIINILLRNGGAETEAENIDGRTPMHHAFARHAHLNGLIERILIQPGLSIDKLSAGISDDVKKYQVVMQRRAKRAASRFKLAAAGISVPEMIAQATKSEPPDFRFTKHPLSIHEIIYKREKNDLELLFLAIDNQNMLIKLLLDAGGDLQHENKDGDPAFITSARFDWFDIHEDEMTDIYDIPNDIGYDSKIFTDKRTQVAVRTRWIATGQRTRALKDLLYWMAFLALLTFVAMRYSGRDSYDAIAIHTALTDTLVDDEWDTFESKTLLDITDTESWNTYLKTIVVPVLWQNESLFYASNGDGLSTIRKVTSGALLNGQIALLGRPRYRQIRSTFNSCSRTNPALLEQASETCFVTATRGIYQTISGSVEDRSPFDCPLTGGGSLRIVWESTPAFPIMGKFGFYNGNGFCVTLPVDLNEASSLIQDLENCPYLALNTRIAIIEFTVFSRTLQLFSHCTLFIELSSGGAIATGARITTRKLVSYSSSGDYFDIIGEALWLCMVLYYFFEEATAMATSWGEEHIKSKNTPMVWWFCIKSTPAATEHLMENPKSFNILMAFPRIFQMEYSLCFYKTNRVVSPYWVDIFNYFDIVIISLIISLISVHIALLVETGGSLEAWYNASAENEFVNITHILWLAQARQYLLAGIVFLCYIKSLEYLQVSAKLAIPVIIIGAMLLQLLGFFLIFAVFILAFALFDFVLYGLMFTPNSSVLKSIILTFRGALGDLDFESKYLLDNSVSIFMTCLSAFLLIILILNLLIAVMNEAYDEIKESAEARWCYIQFRHIVEHQTYRDTTKFSKPDWKKLFSFFKKPFRCICGKRKSKLNMVQPVESIEYQDKRDSTEQSLVPESILLQGLDRQQQEDKIRQQQKLANFMKSKSFQNKSASSGPTDETQD